MSRATVFFCILFLVALAGCSKKGEQAQSPAPPEQQAPAQPASPAQAEAPSTAPEAAPGQTPAQRGEKNAARKATPAQNPRSSASAPASRSAAAGERGVPGAAAPATSEAATQVAPPAAPQPLVIPSGTKLNIRLAEALDSGTNKTGDTFQATLDQDVTVDGKIVAPRGTTVTGKPADVKQSGRVQGVAQMSLALNQIRIGDAVYPIQTNVLSFQAETTKNKDAAKVGIGAGIGAIIGAIAGGGKGAAIGAAVGGGAGGATVIATRGKELNFPAEHQFSFTLRSDVTLR